MTQARREAYRLKQLVERGGDPLADDEAERAAPTMVDLCDRFEAEHLPRLRPSTRAEYRSILRRYVRPHFGSHVKVAGVAFADVDGLHRRITEIGNPYRANRALALCSKTFQLAVKWNMRDKNPCVGVEKNTEEKRYRYLVDDELPRLAKALAAHPDRAAANVFRLLLLTGARRGEVLGARWADLDLGAGKWTKPASSTKQKRSHIAPLSAPAQQLLWEIREQQAKKHRTLPEFVFPGRGATGHVREVVRAWHRVCRAAGITNLRIHDLRHSFASLPAGIGGSLPMIGALLGHSSPATTQRYAHLHADPLKDAVERIGEIVEAAGADKPAPVQPTPITAGRRRARAAK